MKKLGTEFMKEILRHDTTQLDSKSAHEVTPHEYLLNYMIPVHQTINILFEFLFLKMNLSF